MSSINSLFGEQKKFLIENCTDWESRQEIRYLSEMQVANLSDKHITALYNDAIDKYKDVEFENIPKSKGDITKYIGYDNLKGSIELMRYIQVQSNNPFPELDTVQHSFEILQQFKPDFIKGFAINSEFTCVIYNTMVLSIMEAVSYLISVSVEYVKDRNYNDYNIVISTLNNGKGNLVIKTLKDINDLADKGKLSKIIQSSLNSKAENFTGTTVTLIILGISLSLIPLIRLLIYYFYNHRIKIAEYLQIQSNFLESNIHLLKQNTTMSSDKLASSIYKQEKAVAKLRYFATKINVESNEAENKANKMIASNNTTILKMKSDINQIDSDLII